MIDNSMLSTGSGVFLDCRSGEVQGSVSRKSWYLFGPEKLFCVCRSCIQDQSFNNFENDTKKKSVYEAN